jgi:hypothetical protein
MPAIAGSGRSAGHGRASFRGARVRTGLPGSSWPGFAPAIQGSPPFTTAGKSRENRMPRAKLVLGTRAARTRGAYRIHISRGGIVSLSAPRGRRGPGRGGGVAVARSVGEPCKGADATRADTTFAPTPPSPARWRSHPLRPEGREGYSLRGNGAEEKRRSARCVNTIARGAGHDDVGMAQGGRRPGARPGEAA